MSKIQFAFLIFILLFELSCNNTDKQKNATGPLSLSGEGNSYNVFLKKFYTDCNFQKNRIKFPLKGIKVGGDSLRSYAPGSDVTYIWTTNNWECLSNGQSGIVDTTYFNGDTLISGSFIRYAGYNTWNKFYLFEGKWYLISRSEFHL